MGSYRQATAATRDRATVPAQPAGGVSPGQVAPRRGMSRQVPSRLRQTPGRLSVTLAALVVLGLITGVTALVGAQQRADLVQGVTARSGHLAVAAQNLYRALSDADATAASAFLSNGLEPAPLRERYQRDISDATAALVVVSAGAGTDGRGAAAVARITARLPVYSGLVETARTYNRQGLPLGVAYLQQASGLMRDDLLPAAQELYAAVSGALDAARDRAAGFPWFAMLLGLATLAGLVATQIHLTRRTNRLLNVGLLVATGAAVLMVSWLGLSAVVAAGNLRASHDQGSAQVDRLTEARIAGLQARADEALTLVARGNGAAFEKDYTALLVRLSGDDGSGGLLAAAAAAAPDSTTRDAVTAAGSRARDWVTVHRQVRAFDESGEYAKAVAATVGTGPGTTASIFNEFDETLARAIAHNSDRFEREAGSAGRALTGLDIGVIGLTVLLLAGATVGMQRRIVEYR